MIFYDRVGIVVKTRTGSDPAVEQFNGIVPAIVTPISSAEVYSATGVALTVVRYLFVIKPFSYLIPLNAASGAPVTNGTQIIFTYGGNPSLLLESKVERHLFRGRLHHYEAIAKG